MTRILVGDVLEQLATLESESVNCVVTSPPYYGLRDYKVPGQIGLEPTLGEYLSKMVAVFEEVRRVLRKDGVLWLNMGDSYCGSGNPGGGWGGLQSTNKGSNGDASNPRHIAKHGLKPKDLMGVPWRLAFALQDAGWWLRSDIVWHKPNPMPESVHDRPTRSHEYIFLLTKSARYWYDADAIRTVESAETKQLSYDTMDYKRRDKYKTPDGWDTSKGEGGHGSIHKNGREKGQVPVSQRYGGPNSAFRKKHCPNSSQPNDKPTEGYHEPLTGANARTVWTIATVGFPEAHFATFPPELPRRCILAGCPEGGTVLDPFLGSGTTLMVAQELGRNGIGIELNPEYAEMAEKRIADGQVSLFTEAPQ